MTTGGTTPHWTWLIVLVPLALVVGAVALCIIGAFARG